MLGHFAACPANAVCIGPLAPRSHVPVASCHTCRLCALCISPFPRIQSALNSHASSLILDPLPSPFFLLLGTRPPTCLPRRAHPLISSPLFSIRSLVQGAHHGCVYPHSMNHLCILSTPHLLLVCCAPPPFLTIRYPWSLLFFFIPIPFAFGVELQNPVTIVELGSSV